MEIAEIKAREQLRRVTWLVHINGVALTFSVAMLVYDFLHDYPWFFLAQILILIVNFSSVRVSWRSRRAWVGLINQYWGK